MSKVPSKLQVTLRVRAGGAATRLRLFDEATARQARRQADAGVGRTGGRGWTRAELYARGRAR